MFELGLAWGLQFDWLSNVSEASKPQKGQTLVSFIDLSSLCFKSYLSDMDLLVKSICFGVYFLASQRRVLSPRVRRTAGVASSSFWVENSIFAKCLGAMRITWVILFYVFL